MAWVLVAVMALTPSLVYAQQPVVRQQKAVQGGGEPDLGYITPESVAAAVAHPRRVLTAPEAEMLPLEVMTAAGKKELGIDPLQIEWILCLAEPPRGGPPRAAVVIRMSSPIGPQKVFGALWEETEEGQLAGKPYRQANGPMQASLFRPDDRTIIVGHDDLVRRMVSNHAAPKQSRVGRLLAEMGPLPDAAAVVSVEPLRPLLVAALAQAEIPPPLAGVDRVPELVSSVSAKVNLIGDMAMSVSVKANDEDAAKELEAFLDRMLAVAKQAMLAEVAKVPATKDPVQAATVQYMKRVSDRMIGMLRPQRKGDSLSLATRGRDQAYIATVGVLVALLLPAVQAAREAARRSQSVNNLKQIGLAMLIYHDVHKTFPARANFDKQGKPLLSWRVHILPFIEQKELYRQFHLDEPWDSEHNRKLIAAMPPVYRNPSSPAKPGMTDYLAVSGEGMMFAGDKGRTMADIRDGTSNTIMVLEVNPERAVIWTKPDDWEYDASEPFAGLGKAHPGGFQALLADGAVRFIAQTIDPKVFHALLTVAGGERTGPDF